MKNKKGFTITEIIAVIVIIGLIVIVAIPASQKLMNDNKTEKYMLYVETIEKAMYTYGDLYMSNGDNIDFSYGSSVYGSDFFKKLNLEKFDGDDNVLYSTDISIIKGENGKVELAPEDLEIEFDGKTCSKTQCN